jgi:hemoglobin
MSEQVTVYELVGEERFALLVDAFYRGVEQDPLLRPMYPEDLTEAKERMTLFLIQYWDGPRRYDELRGHPRLRLRHMPFPIGEAERDAWLKHMRAAVEEARIPEPARTAMLNHYEHTAHFLVNKEAWEAPRPEGRGA